MPLTFFFFKFFLSKEAARRLGRKNKKQVNRVAKKEKKSKKA